MKSLVERVEIYVLDAMSPEIGFCTPVAGLAFDLEVDREFLLGVLRTLRKKGDVEYFRGLFREDGTVGGAGYAITDAGKARLRAFDTQAKDFRRLIENGADRLGD